MHTGREHINTVLETIAKDSFRILAPLAKVKKTAFLQEITTRVLEKILIISTEKGDMESCSIIKGVIDTRSV